MNHIDRSDIRTIRRFIAKFEAASPEACWPWRGALGMDGYGKVGIRGKHFRAHRVAYELFVSRIPDSLFICHTCDNRQCVNPSHLWVGTNHDNSIDRMVKGRGRAGVGERHGSRTKPDRVPRGDRNGSRLHPERLPHGENHHGSKLTRADVAWIRSNYVRGSSTKGQGALAAKYGVTQGSIHDVIARKTWKLPEDAST
jgi:hypothetical protein